MLASLLFAAGCSKNRGWLSRKDYSEMQADPFMEPDTAVADASDRKSRPAGRASLDDVDPALAEGRVRVSGATTDSMSGPTSMQQAGSTKIVTQDGRRVASTTYPEDNANIPATSDKPEGNRSMVVKSYSGPALSDFLQNKKAHTDNSAPSAATDIDQLPARTVSASNTQAQERLNPAATRAALPAITADAETFSNFLSQTSNEVSNAEKKVNEKTQGAGDEVSNFSSWAEQQKSEWSKSGNNARSAVNATPELAKEKAKGVFEQARQVKQEMADAALATPDFDAEEFGPAEQLIQKRRADNAAPVLSRAKSPAAYGFTPDENPFADSPKTSQSSDPIFAETPSPKPAAPSATARSKSTPSSLDDGFRISTGWKPAHMTRP